MNGLSLTLCGLFALALVAWIYERRRWCELSRQQQDHIAELLRQRADLNRQIDNLLAFDDEFDLNELEQRKR